MVKFSDLMAAGSLAIMTSLIFPSVVSAEPLQAVPVAQGTTVSADIASFMSNYAPTECTVQFGYVESGDFRRRLAQNFTRTMDSLMVSQPANACEAVTGTDNGRTRNFNFIRADHGVYKVITRSDYSYDEVNTLYEYEVLGIRFIPINAEGELDPENARTLLSLGQGTCEIDDPEDPFDVFL